MTEILGQIYTRDLGEYFPAKIYNVIEVKEVDEHLWFVTDRIVDGEPLEISYWVVAKFEIDAAHLATVSQLL